MTIRLTDAQMTVLRALDKLPEGEWITAKEGKFHNSAAAALHYQAPSRGWQGRIVQFRVSSAPLQYRVSKAGRDLIATLKADGRW